MKLDTTVQNHFITCSNNNNNTTTDTFRKFPAVEGNTDGGILHDVSAYFLPEVPGSSDDDGVSLEVLNVDVSCATHQQLEGGNGG